MNSKQSVSLSEFSRGEWADEPPPEPSPRPDLGARVRSWLSKLSPLMNVSPLMRVRSWIGELAPLTGPAASSLTEPAALTFARYLIAFFIGVVATVAWQSFRSEAKDETVAVIPAALDSVRQSVDNLAAEITRMKSVEQDILGRIPATPPQPVAAPARNPQRPSSIR